jgi:hypothetical protein
MHFSRYVSKTGFESAPPPLLLLVLVVVALPLAFVPLYRPTVAMWVPRRWPLRRVARVEGVNSEDFGSFGVGL